jgi:hypothetical protein
MSDKKIKRKKVIQMAANFLFERSIRFIEPIDVTTNDGEAFEVVFTVAQALDSDVVVDPPDIRVRVNVHTQRVELVFQM